MNALLVKRVEEQRAGHDSICSRTAVWEPYAPDAAVAVQLDLRMLVDQVANRSEPLTGFRRGRGVAARGGGLFVDFVTILLEGERQRVRFGALFIRREEEGTTPGGAEGG